MMRHIQKEVKLPHHLYFYKDKETVNLAPVTLAFPFLICFDGNAVGDRRLTPDRSLIS